MLLLLCNVLLVLCSKIDGKAWTEQDMMSAKSWQAMESWIKDWVQDSSSKLSRILDGAEVSTECRRDARSTLEGLDSMQHWAVRMLDSWAKIPSGFSSGITGLNGDYDACLSVRHPDEKFRGQYCNVRAKQPLPDFGKVHLWSVNSKFPEFADMAFRNNTIMNTMVRDRIVWYYRYPYKIGVCIPSTCTKEDLATLASEAFKDLQWSVSIDDCQVDEEISQLNAVQKVTLTCAVVLLVVIAVATYMDTTHQEENSGWRGHFSLRRSWNQLTECPSGGSKFNFLDGMRVFLTAWTILMHTCSMYEPTVLSGCYSTVYLVENPLLQIIMNGWASVDSFFCITGFLTGYSLLRRLRREGGDVNWIKYIFRRLCRLSPTMWALLGLVYLSPILGSGSHWPEVFQKDVDRCHRSWLPVVLFVNNWFKYDEMCLPMTWYLSVDVQLYIIGTCFVYVIYKWPSAGFKACLLAVALSSLWLGATTYMNDLQPTLIWETFDLEFREEMLRLTYLGFSPHLAPFLIGVLTGYLLDKFPDTTFRKSTLAICWTASIISFGAIILSGHPWHNARWPSTTVAALYQALHKIIWALATSWIIFACATGHGGLFDKAFSWSGFSTLSKLSFLMGLLNIPVIRFKNSLLRRYIYLSLLDLFYDFLGHLVMCIVLSTVLYLLVESPFASLSESHLKDNKKTKKS